MKNILYSVLTTLKRFKMASTLNILGLTAAFTIFTVIAMQLYWEQTHNHALPDRENTYLVYYTNNGEVGSSFTAPIATSILEESSAVSSYANFYGSWYENTLFTVQGEDKAIYLDASRITLPFFDMFGIETIEGDIEKLSAPETIAVPLSFAKKHWGDSSPIGETLVCDPYPDEVYTIVAVVADSPSNSSFANRLFIVEDLAKVHKYNWGYSFFVKMHSNSDKEQFAEEFGKKHRTRLRTLMGEGAVIDSTAYPISLKPVDELYFDYLSTDIGVIQGNKTLSNVLLSIAILILVMAVINYINFYMSLVPIKIKIVNISKIFGASVRTLRMVAVMEAVLTVMISFALSLLFVNIVSDLDIAEFTKGASTAIEDNAVIVSAVGILALLIGLFSGLFPAWYITRFAPSMVLRGSFARSGKGRALRGALSVFQFSIAIALIIGSLFIALQNSMMKNYDYGLNHDRVVNVNITPTITENKDGFTASLKSSTMIEDVAYLSSYIGQGLSSYTMRKGEQMIELHIIYASYNAPEFFGFKLADGRMPNEHDMAGNGVSIINEYARNKYDLTLGFDLIGGKHKAVGFVDDYKFGSLRQAMAPVALWINSHEMDMDWDPNRIAYIRLAKGANYTQVVEYISKTMTELDPMITPNSINITPMDEMIESMYRNEEHISQVVTLFSGVAIVIALLGVFGIVFFEMQHRRKEVSVRKVFGASVRSILGRFNRQVLWVLAVSVVIAIPAVWYGASKWLEGFAYRIDLNWWVFVLGVLIVALIVITMVTLQTWRAANANPTKYLKSE